MKLRIYDIFAILIPGLMVTMSLKHSYFSTIDITDIEIIIIGFFTGYLVNTLSSWLEPLCFLTWGGKPSTRLLEGKGIWKISFSEYEKLKYKLNKESTTEDPSIESIWEIAYRKAKSNKNDRLQIFQDNYSLSRSFLVTIMIIYIIFNIRYCCNLYFIIIGILVLLLIWYRTKQTGYYFAKETLQICLNIIDEK